ncbi:MAG: enoyl-CoA hydratase/isomerase family protein [Nitrospira sp.]|nr:enoyl-CoA hydratase/isomerase family protein [Nitrospira sp.]
MKNTEQSKHWYTELDKNMIAWLHFDMAGTGTNVLSAEVLNELSEELAVLKHKEIQGLIILSDKKNGFIAGADIKEFTKFQSPEEASNMIRQGQAVFERLENMPYPTVSMIHGFCLGGGMELALACNYRVAEDHEKTKLGLPEVKLGIHPGFGGTVRLPRLTGALKAMDIMLSGRTLNAQQAKKAGMVDYVVPKRHLKKMAVMCIQDRMPVRKPSLWLRLSNAFFIRPLLKIMILRNLKTRVSKEHYPAPFAIVDLWAKYYSNQKTMMKEEALSVAKLMTGTTSQNLVRIFFLSESLKSMGREIEFPVSHIHVIGAGVMGGDIAAWCALQGFTVTLQDREAKFIAPAMKRAYSLFNKRLKQPRLVQKTMDRLMPDINGKTGLKKADVIIEAIFENADAKKALYKEIEPQLKPNALLATNTSSIPLENLSEALSNPGRLVGLHFFNPVAKMPLVEIVKGTSTDDEEVKKAASFAQKISRLPLPVKSTPGFLVNRILMPYMLEAVTMAEEGSSPAEIDRAAVKFGMPMGPLLLADTVGLDICLHVAEIISEGIEMPVPEKLRAMTKKGNLGRKSGQGFYRYKNGRQIIPSGSQTSSSDHDLTDRLILRMVNEAVACLNEGVVENAELLDAGVIFGTGFAPFRGGPLNYWRTEGEAGLNKRLTELEAHYGRRFHPAGQLKGAHA